MVQIFYSVGILCSYCLQIIPTFKVMNLIPLYKSIPNSENHPGVKSLITRLTVAFLCCSMAYFMPNLGQFLNFQGAVGGILLTFVFPIVFYFKTFGDRITKKEKVFCIAIVSYGVIGGVWATYYSLSAIFGNK